MKMFDYKLTVLKRKIFEYAKETGNLFGVMGKDTKAIAKRLEDLTDWKFNRSIYLFRSTEETPAGKVFSSLYRCLNFSFAALITPHPSIWKIWKTLIPLPNEWKFRISKKSPRYRWLPRGKSREGHPPEEKESLSARVGKGLLDSPESSKTGLQSLGRVLPSSLSLESLPEALSSSRSTFSSLSLPLASAMSQKQDIKGKEQGKYAHSFAPYSKNRPVKHNYHNFKSFKNHQYAPQVEITPKMEALLFNPLTLSLSYDRVNAPGKIFKDEVLVQVAYSGVSSTDIFITEGKVNCGDGPVILGHEISGKVYAVGSDVQHVKRGDVVAVNACSACSVCRYCSRGLFSSCLTRGLNSKETPQNGGWTEFVVVKKSQVHKIPDGLGLDRAALTQPLSCILSALSKLNIQYGMDVFIQGLGLSGCLWAALLHSRGHKNVIVTDKSEKKKAHFESLGLDYEIVPPEDIVKKSADVIIECAGSPNHIEKSFNIVNSNGKLCFFETPNPMLEVRCIPYDIIKKDITIVGNSGNSLCFTEALQVGVSLGSRYLDFEKLGIHTFDLSDYRDAFQMKKSEEVTKIVFKMKSS